MFKFGKYKHYKGKNYEVIGVARHSETLEEFVVYFDEKRDLWVRPLSEFTEEVEIDGKKMPRFDFNDEQ